MKVFEGQDQSRYKRGIHPSYFSWKQRKTENAREQGPKGYWSHSFGTKSSCCVIRVRIRQGGDKARVLQRPVKKLGMNTDLEHL